MSTMLGVVAVTKLSAYGLAAAIPSGTLSSQSLVTHVTETPTMLLVQRVEPGSLVNNLTLASGSPRGLPITLGVGFAFVTVFGVLWVFYRRTLRSASETGERAGTGNKAWASERAVVPQPVETTDEAQPAPSATTTRMNVDLRLLQHLSDGTEGGFQLEIQRYLSAFELDLQEARTIFAGGDRKQIHQIAHRLIAHSGAVHCESLINLASTMQSHAAGLPQSKLDELLRAFDRQFASLKNTLESHPASTVRG